MQPKFSFAALLGAVAMFGVVLAADAIFDALPNRQPEPPAVAALYVEPIEISGDLAPLVLAGAWRLTSPEPRFGGISGLALDGDQFVALTDAGAILRFSKALRPGSPVAVAELPSGPGSARFKQNRDSEAIVRDPAGRGWWVAFEGRDALWLYDTGFTRALTHIWVQPEGLGYNTGIEGLVARPDALIAFPESGGVVLGWSRAGRTNVPRKPQSPISDAAQIDGQSVFLLERRVTALGFRTALTFARPDGASFRTAWRRRLPVRRRDNLEGIAAEPLTGGGYRVWIISDDNFHPRLRTVLLAIDVPAALLPKRP